MSLSLHVQAASGRFVLPVQLAGDCFPAWDSESGCRFSPVRWSVPSTAAEPAMSVSLQGVRLSATQRMRGDQQARLQASIRSQLGDQVEQTLQAVQKAKEQGAAKPFKQWQVIHAERGTLFLGDVFGYGPALSCDPLPDGDDSDWQAYQLLQPAGQFSPSTVR